MTNHLSARVAWHMDGWNGRICRDPASNTYCIGRNSYPNLLKKSQLVGINASLFSFRPVLTEMGKMHEWYEEGKIHHTLADIMVRSKSEVIIANMFAE